MSAEAGGTRAMRDTSQRKEPPKLVVIFATPLKGHTSREIADLAGPVATLGGRAMGDECVSPSPSPSPRPTAASTIKKQRATRQ